MMDGFEEQEEDKHKLLNASVIKLPLNNKFDWLISFEAVGSIEDVFGDPQELFGLFCIKKDEVVNSNCMNTTSLEPFLGILVWNHKIFLLV